MQLEYQHYTGSVEYEQEDKCYWGKLLTYNNEPINDLILYEGDTIEQLEEDFKEAIKTYEYE